MPISEQIRQQLIASFHAEVAEHIQTMTDGLLALEQNRVAGEQKAEMLRTIFRAAHSLKGAARAVGVNVIAQMAHALEDVLDGVNKQTVEPMPDLFTACYKVLDAIQEVEKAFAAGATTPPPQALQAISALDPFRSSKSPAAESAPIPVATPTPAKVTAVPLQIMADTPSAGEEAPALRIERGGTETIRVDATKLDALMDQLSELHITRIRAEQRLAQVKRVQEAINDWQKEWLAVREVYGRLNRRLFRDPGYDRLSRDAMPLLAYLTTSQENLRDMVALVNELEREYSNDTMQLSLTIDTLENEIKRTRMLPLSTITATFGRMVRDLAYSASKEVALTVIGGDVELDKRVLEQIKDPLIHLLRNAVDHGIEMPQVRLSQGKPRVGTIVLKAEQVGKNVVITVGDDGQGLDFAAIRHALARRSTTDTLTLSDDELIAAIFNLGISTSPTVTDVSGRGVGLDVVRRNVEGLNGSVHVTTEQGKGTTFTLTLPLALSSSRALVVQVSNQTYAIPLMSIERILEVSPQEIYPVGGRETLRYNGAIFNVVHLGDVLGLPRHATDRTSSPTEHLTVLLLTSAQRRMAFLVDALHGEQEVVIKGLGRQVQRLGGIAGATITGDGTVLLVLNVGDLFKLAMHKEAQGITTAPLVPPQTATPQKLIFIVDDSITTRTLEKNILEAAGYKVCVATDGLEALNAIEANVTLPDLVISDIAMPRLDGISLTQKLKSDPRTLHIPVVLVTSLASDADKARGIEAGADAYVVKSNFDQNNLLETIEQLI